VNLNLSESESCWIDCQVVFYLL